MTEQIALTWRSKQRWTLVQKVQWCSSKKLSRVKCLIQHTRASQDKCFVSEAAGKRKFKDLKLPAILSFQGWSYPRISKPWLHISPSCLCSTLFFLMKILPQQMPCQCANNISRGVWSRHATDKEDWERQQQTLENSQMINCKGWMTPCPILKAQGLPGSWRPRREVSIPVGARC